MEQKYSIIVIEDEKLLLEAISKKLNLNGFSVIPFDKGQDAVSYVRNHSNAVCDAIWLDYHLTDLNGLEFVQALKQEKQWEHVPIMVVSNSASKENVHNMLALGISKYLLKAEYRLDKLTEIAKEIIIETKDH